MKGDVETSRVTARARFWATPSSAPCHGQQWDARPGLFFLSVCLSFFFWRCKLGCFLRLRSRWKLVFCRLKRTLWIYRSANTVEVAGGGESHRKLACMRSRKEKKARAGLRQLRRRPRCRQQQYPALSLTAKIRVWTHNFSSAAPLTVSGAGRRH